MDKGNGYSRGGDRDHSGDSEEGNGNGQSDSERSCWSARRDQSGNGSGDRQQDRISSNDSQQRVNVQLVPGSMVWAQQPGWPWWPAMIRGESKDGLSMLIRNSGDEIYVQFFHNPPTAAWIPTRSLKPYHGSKDVNAPPISRRDKNLKNWVISCDFADAEPFSCSSSEERLEKYLIVFEDETYNDWLKTFNATAEKMGLGRPDQSTPPTMERSNEYEKVVYKNTGMTPKYEAECASKAGYTFIAENTMSPLIRRLQEEQIRRKHYVRNREALACVCREVRGRKCTFMSRCPNVKAKIACPATCGSACQNNPWLNNQFLVGKKTFLRSTTSKGLGLFASSSIEKQKFLGEYTGSIMRASTTENPEVPYYFEAQPQPTDLVINSFKQGSALRLLNHSCQPNCEAMHYVHDNFYKVVLKTVKDIKRGNEITIDYGWVISSIHKAMKCVCKAKNCKGIIETVESSDSDDEACFSLQTARKSTCSSRNPGAIGNKTNFKKSISTAKRPKLAKKRVFKQGDSINRVDVTPLTPVSIPIELSANEFNGVPNRLVVPTLPQPDSQSPSFSGNNGINQGQDPPAAPSSNRSIKEEDSEWGNEDPSKNPSPGVTRPELAEEAISAVENSDIVLDVSPPEPIIIDLSGDDSDDDPKLVVASTLRKHLSISGNNGINQGQDPPAASSCNRGIKLENSESGNNPPSKKPSPRMARPKVEDEAISEIGNAVIVASWSISSSAEDSNKVPNPLFVASTSQSSPSFSSNDQDPPAASSCNRGIKLENTESGNEDPSKKPSHCVARPALASDSIAKIGDPVTDVDVSPPASNPINSTAEESNEVTNSVVASTLQSPRSFSVNNETNKGSDPAASSSQPSIQGNPSGNSNSSWKEAGGQQGSSLKNIGHIPQLSYLQQQNSTLQQQCEQANKTLQQQLQGLNTTFLQPNMTHAQQIVAFQNHLRFQNLALEQHNQTLNLIIQQHHQTQDYIIQQQFAKKN